MSKELEALERIKQATYFVDFELNATVGEDYEEEIAIIETALKDYEELKSRENNVLPTDEFIGDLGEQTRDEIAIKLKALEIIKEKEVNVFIFLHSGDLETYNDIVEYDRKLTQQEYDLLKEWLK